MKKLLVLVFGLFVGALFLMPGSVATATELIYTPVNPSFGGSPFNGAWLLSSAQAQNKFKEPSRYTPRTFSDRLESMILNRLAGDIVNNMFGEEGLEPGHYTIGEYTVDVGSDGEYITVVINGPEGETTIEVPYY